MAKSKVMIDGEIATYKPREEKTLRYKQSERDYDLSE